MLVAIDAGNTETKLGCYRDGEDVLAQTWRVQTDARRTPDELGALLLQLFESDGLSPQEVRNVVIASVVPTLDAALEAACARTFGVTPVFFEPHRQRLIEIRTERAEEVGADLVAMAIGGRARYGSPLVVVSYGTATVFMAIDSGGDYSGVAIAPGIQISIDALVGRAAKLPQVALEAPQSALGRNTVEAMQAGFFYGFVGQTEALISRMRKEMGVEARVVATGGLAQVIAPHCASIERVDAHLSLEGLRLFARSARA